MSRLPEGDTVFLACRRLHEALAQTTLVRGELRHPRWSTENLAGKRAREVVPAGKHLLMRFNDDRTLHSHLRMDGAWHLYSSGGRWQRPEHQVRAVLATTERIAVGFNLHDLALVRSDQEDRIVGHLGPDLLAPDWGEQHRAEAIRRLAATPAQEIGLALLDQTVLAGVGNLYKTEVCFLLGTHPWTPVSEVDTERAVDLCRALLSRNAEHPQQFTTDDPRLDAQHWVYRRRACLRCGHTIHRGTQGGVTEERLTYHCPRCQASSGTPRPRRKPGSS